jgi:hypothetical protein
MLCWKRKNVLIFSVQGGQYVVLEMLGKGAYGAVYRARRCDALHYALVLKGCRYVLFKSGCLLQGTRV